MSPKRLSRYTRAVCGELNIFMCCDEHTKAEISEFFGVYADDVKAAVRMFFPDQNDWSLGVIGDTPFFVSNRTNITTQTIDNSICDTIRVYKIFKANSRKTSRMKFNSYESILKTYLTQLTKFA